MDPREAYDKNFACIYRYFYYRGAPGADAEELCQETFLRFFQKYRPVDLDELGVRKIVYKIAANVYKEWVRERVQLPVYELDRDFPIPEVEEEDDPFEFSDDCRESLLAAIEQLHPTMKTVLTMRFVEGKTRREVAEVLSIKEKDVHTYQKRGIRMLREKLAAVPLPAYT